MSERPDTPQLSATADQIREEDERYRIEHPALGECGRLITAGETRPTKGSTVPYHRAAFFVGLARVAGGPVSDRVPYNRVGLGSRLVEFRPDGSIGRGQADCERWWWVWEEGGCHRLAIYGLYGLPQEFSPNTGGCRTDLTLEAVETGPGRFTGRWVRHEECLVSLERVSGD